MPNCMMKDMHWWSISVEVTEAIAAIDSGFADVAYSCALLYS
jgi:hypothetical protein